MDSPDPYTGRYIASINAIVPIPISPCAALPGLTSAMYMRGPEGVGNPDPQAGLYIVSINAIVPIPHHTLWCITRVDTPITPCAALLGLTSAMYMRGSEGVGNPDPQAGLYIRQRQGAEVVQAPIPADQIAFQMGEAMQVPPPPPPMCKVSCVLIQSYCAKV